MPNEEKGVIPLGPAGGESITEITSPLAPNLSSILSGAKPLSDKRREVLIALGLRRPRQKYTTPALKKTAAKKRRKERKLERNKELAKYGLAPRKRGKKLTTDQKNKRRNERGKNKRAGLREMARANPDLAKKFGIDPTRFRL